jgi:hypothetical protein
VVGFTTGSRGKVPGKTCEKRTKKIIIIDVAMPSDRNVIQNDSEK